MRNAKGLLAALALTAALPATAVPVMYVFEGHITELRDSFYEGGDDEGFHDWWPSVGDAYHGSYMFDASEVTTVGCSYSATCGGLIWFGMTIGDNVLRFTGATHSIETTSYAEWTGWGQSISYYFGGGLDSFVFQSGSFTAVDSAFWDGISGEVDMFRVPEPTTIGLLGLGFAGLLAARRKT